MKNIILKCLISILSIQCFYACKQTKDKQASFEVLQPFKYIKASELESVGFERVWGVDVYLYSFNKGDTLIIYQYDNPDDLPLYQWWEFSVVKDSVCSSISQVAEAHGYRLMTKCIENEKTVLLNRKGEVLFVDDPTYDSLSVVSFTHYFSNE